MDKEHLKEILKQIDGIKDNHDGYHNYFDHDFERWDFAIRTLLEIAEVFIEQELEK